MVEPLGSIQDLATKGESQVVTFYLGDEEFGFDIMSVQEIIRQPVLCRIPMAPSYVEGIANLRGMVLPIIDTRTRFGMARQVDTDATRVLVVDVDGHKTGLRVDRVRQVTRIQHGEMEAPPAVIRHGTASDYLDGVAKLEGGKRLIMSLSPAAICRIEGQAAGQPIGEATRAALAPEGPRFKAVAEVATDQSTAQIVSFTLGDEEFAFSMEQVREILRVEPPSEVPDTPDYVLGIVTVRGKILPVIDLRLLLGLPTLSAEIVAWSARMRERYQAWLETVGAHAQTGGAHPGTAVAEQLKAWLTTFATSSQALMETLGALRVANEKVVRGFEQTFTHGRAAAEPFARDVLPHATHALRLMTEFEDRVPSRIAEDQRLIVVQSGGTMLALMVDRVREVLNVPRRLIDPPPQMAAADGRNMAGVVKLDEGKRLIMLLDADRLVRGRALDALHKATDGGGEMQKSENGVAADKKLAESHSLGERQFVTFRLADGEYGIPIDQIQEIDRPSRMTRIPGSAAYVDGITNLRGEVIPVINARKRFGLPLREVDEQTRVIIIELDGKKTGLLVDSVREVLNQAQRDIAPPPPSIGNGVDRQYISGIGNADGGKRMIALLDVSMVLEA